MSVNDPMRNDPPDIKGISVPPGKKASTRRLQRNLNKYLRLINEQTAGCSTLEEALQNLVKWFPEQPTHPIPMMFEFALANQIIANALGTYIANTANAHLHEEFVEDLKWILSATVDRVLDVCSERMTKRDFVKMRVEWIDDVSRG